MNVPFLDLKPMHDSIEREMASAFDKVYASNQYILGPELSRFEESYANYTGTNYAVGTSSGLDALVMCLRAIGVGKGHEVIVPSNAYIAAALAVSHVGAKPVFVEPEEESFNINPNLLKSAFNERTKAIIVVHMFGQSCKMKEIMEVARSHSVQVIEDNAQSQGSSYNGQRTGSWGHINATSFYPTKNLGALGDGGCVTTNSDELAQRVRSFRNYGSIKKNETVEIGYNNRLDELQAALLSVKLKRLPEWNDQRKKAAELYCDQLADVEEVQLPKVADWVSHVYHLFVIRTKKRDGLAKFLTGQGVETRIHYPIPPHLQTAYTHLGHQKGDFPIAEQMAATSLSLPIYPRITEGQIMHVCKSIKAFFNG